MFVLQEKVDGKFRNVDGKFQYGQIRHAEKRAEKDYGGKLNWEMTGLSRTFAYGTDAKGKIWYQILHFSKNPKRKQTMARKKKRSAKQLANDRRLGRMAKARAKAKRGGRRKVTRKKTARRKVAKRKTTRRANPKRTTRAKSHLWLVFRAYGKNINFYNGGFPISNQWVSKGKAALYQTKEQARAVASKLRVSPRIKVGFASSQSTVGDIRRALEGK